MMLWVWVWVVGLVEASPSLVVTSRPLLPNRFHLDSFTLLHSRRSLHPPSLFPLALFLRLFKT
jgi:hypothetical protein